MAKAKYKPLSFSMTIRNPERVASFLRCLAPFEGQNLTNTLIDKIVFSIIKEKLYEPVYINHNTYLKDIYNDEDAVFLDSQVQEIIDNAPQNHKEAGFDPGWPSRFDTWFKIQMEFGFLWYEIGEPLTISQTGHMLIDALNQQQPDNKKIQNIFLNAMAKYQTSNPFRKNLNDNVPLVLLLNVLKKLKTENEKSTGISRGEISFFICWPDNDSEALFSYIKGFREKYKFGQYTDEVIYNCCLSIMGYGPSDKKYIKMNKVVSEAVDEYIRKMKITGVISLRGNGRFIDINTNEQEKVDYILSKYQVYKKFTEKKEYYEYMACVDAKLFDDIVIAVSKTNSVRKNRLLKVAKDYTPKKIIEELINVCKRKESKDPMFKFINAPTRLEFLTSIALVQNFPNLDVNPNYPVDDEGLPTFTASGGMADIECKDTINDELVEVSLICSRAQVNDEMIPITRHLNEARRTKPNTYSVFMAPTLHPDTLTYVDWIKFRDGLDIKAYDIKEFLSALEKYKTFDAMVTA